MPANWQNSAVVTDWKRSVFIPIPKKGKVKEYSNYGTIVLISHTSKVMLKILQARPQQYVNWELPDVQAGFRKGRESEVAQLSPTLCDPMDCSPPGSSIHGILQARVLEWVAISFSRGSSQPMDRTPVSHTTGRLFTVWATGEALVIQWMLAIWSLVPLPFKIQLEHLEVHGSRTVEAWLGEFWALLYQCVRWVQFCGSLSILSHCLSLGLEGKLTFYSPVATAECFKFAGILSVHFHRIIFQDLK